MKLTILCLRDIKANYYLAPMFVPNIPAAMREFTDMLNSDRNEVWVKHPEDFELYNLGEFDTEDAFFDTEHDGSQTQRAQICVLSALKG